PAFSRLRFHTSINPPSTTPFLPGFGDSGCFAFLSFSPFSLFFAQTLRQGDEFVLTSVRAPGDAAIGQNPHDDAASGAAEGFHEVTGVEIGRFRQGFDN